MFVLQFLIGVGIVFGGFGLLPWLVGHFTTAAENRKDFYDSWGNGIEFILIFILSLFIISIVCFLCYRVGVQVTNGSWY